MTILNQYEILKNVTPTWWIITLMALIVFIFIMTIIATESASRYALAVLSFAIIFTIVWGWVVKPIVTKEDAPTGRYRYECTIDDDASFIDIYHLYVKHGYGRYEDDVNKTFGQFLDTNHLKITSVNKIADDIIEIVTNAFTGSDTSTFVNTSEGISW